MIATPLFRQEVHDAQSSQHLGSIRIGRNPRHATVAAAALLMAAVLVSFGIWGQVTRKARIPGLLLPESGLLQIAATGGGTVVARLAKVGEFVQAGQRLFVLDIDRPGTQGSTAALVAQNLLQRQQTLHAERRLRELQARQRLLANADRLRALALEETQAAAEAGLIARRVALAARSVERFQELAGQGFVSDLQAQARQEEAIDLQARAQAALRLVGGLQREQAALRVDRDATQTQLKTELALVDRNLAALAQDIHENDARRQWVVLAPQAGRLTALHVPLGHQALPGQSLATLVPQALPDGAAPLQAELYAPSRTAGFVQQGQTVWLRYAAYPYQKFGMARGAVVAVSSTPVNPQELPPGQAQALMLAAQANEPLYRVTVALASQRIEAFEQVHALKSGMALEADVVQERRAVWEWLLEPLLAARARLGVAAAAPGGAAAFGLVESQQGEICHA